MSARKESTKGNNGLCVVLTQTAKIVVCRNSCADSDRTTKRAMISTATDREREKKERRKIAQIPIPRMGKKSLAFVIKVGFCCSFASLQSALRMSPPTHCPRIQSRTSFYKWNVCMCVHGASP